MSHTERRERDVTMRRFTLNHHDAAIEGVQFTAGPIITLHTEQGLHAYLDLDALHERIPGAEIQWLDDEDSETTRESP